MSWGKSASLQQRLTCPTSVVPGENRVYNPLCPLYYSVVAKCIMPKVAWGEFSNGTERRRVLVGLRGARMTRNKLVYPTVKRVARRTDSF